MFSEPQRRFGLHPLKLKSIHTDFFRILKTNANVRLVVLQMQFLTVQASAATTNFKIICHVQDYTCFPENPGHCTWMTVIGHEKEFNLTKNPSYPNPSYPNEIWEGQLRDILHYPTEPTKYRLKVKVVLSPTGEKSYSTSLEYEWKNWISFGQGTKTVGAGIIDKDLVDLESKAGRGYYCWGAEFTP